MFRNVVEKSILHICTGFKEILPFHLKIFPLNLCYEIKNLLTVKNNVYEKEQTLFFFLLSLLLFALCAGRAGITNLLEGTSEGCSIR